MLILTRRVGEAVMVGSDVTITVLGVKGNQVRIGVAAPKHVAVHREEIFERIQRERPDASPTDPLRTDATDAHTDVGAGSPRPQVTRSAGAVGGSGALNGAAAHLSDEDRAPL